MSLCHIYSCLECIQPFLYNLRTGCATLKQFNNRSELTLQCIHISRWSFVIYSRGTETTLNSDHCILLAKLYVNQMCQTLFSSDLPAWDICFFVFFCGGCHPKAKIGVQTLDSMKNNLLKLWSWKINFEIKVIMASLFEMFVVFFVCFCLLND